MEEMAPYIVSTQQSPQERGKKTPGSFVEYVLGQYELGPNYAIKASRGCIEACFAEGAVYLERDAQKNFISSLMLKIIEGQELSEADNEVLALRHVEKRFLKHALSYTLGDCLVDLLYLLYEFFPSHLEMEIEYIDKISAAIG